MKDDSRPFRFRLAAFWTMDLKMRIMRLLRSRAMINNFLQQLSPLSRAKRLFDHISDVVYFIKDIRGAYLVVNKTWSTDVR